MTNMIAFIVVTMVAQDIHIYHHCRPALKLTRNINVGALIIRIGFWGILYYKHKKGAPKIV